MLRCRFLCHVLKALFFIKIALKLSYVCKKMQNFRALGAPPPYPLPPAAGGFAPRPPKPAPPLRISGYAPANVYRKFPIYLVGLFLFQLRVYFVVYIYESWINLTVKKLKKWCYKINNFYPNNAPKAKQKAFTALQLQEFTDVVASNTLIPKTHNKNHVIEVFVSKRSHNRLGNSTSET